MKIAIAERFRPFSHENGSICLLPRTCWSVQAFPTLIRLTDREREGGRAEIEIPLRLHGPLREFTLQQDLEKGCVRVWGIALEGRFCLCIEAAGGSIRLWAEKTPKNGIVCANQTLRRNESMSWSFSGLFLDEPQRERLSLGNHRSQEWAGVWRRMDLKEILPALFHVSQWTPRVPELSGSSMAGLLEKGWDGFLRAAFFGIFVPRLADDEYQGLLFPEKAAPDASPIALINIAGERIRALFAAEDKADISLLTSSEFLSGRFTDVQLPGIGVLDFEWTKGMIVRARFRASCDAEVSLRLPKSIQSFRLRTGLKGKGCRKNIGTRLKFEKGNNYFLDQFQK